MGSDMRVGLPTSLIGCTSQVMHLLAVARGVQLLVTSTLHVLATNSIVVPLVRDALQEPISSLTRVKCQWQSPQLDSAPRVTWAVPRLVITIRVRGLLFPSQMVLLGIGIVRVEEGNATRRSNCTHIMSIFSLCLVKVAILNSRIEFASRASC